MKINTNTKRKLLIMGVCTALALLAAAFTLFHNKKIAITKVSPPHVQCVDRIAERPQSLKQLIADSSIIATGTLIPEENMPEVTIEPQYMSNVRVSVGKQLKGVNYDVGKTIQLCPRAVGLYYSTEPVILFLRGIDDKDKYWVPVDAYGPIIESSGQNFYDFQFKDAKSVYSLDQIEQAVTSSYAESKSEHYSTLSKNIYHATDGSFVYPKSWNTEFCTKQLAEFDLPGRLLDSGENEKVVKGYASNLYCKNGKLVLRPVGSQSCRKEDLREDITNLSNGLILRLRGPSEAKVSSIEIKKEACGDSMFAFVFGDPIDVASTVAIDRDQLEKTVQYKEIVQFAESIRLSD